jgi:hypothetical protein
LSILTFAVHGKESLRNSRDEMNVSKLNGHANVIQRADRSPGTVCVPGTVSVGFPEGFAENSEGAAQETSFGTRQLQIHIYHGSRPFAPTILLSLDSVVPVRPIATR